MNPTPMPVLLVWTVVYLGLSGFYFLASYRVRERGTFYLSGVMLGVSLLFGLLWLSEQPLGRVGRLVVHFAMVSIGALTPALHSAFLQRFAELPVSWNSVVRAGHFWAGAIIVADAVERLLGLVRGTPLLTHPGAEVAIALAAGLLGHVAFAVKAYWLVFQRGRRSALALLGLTVAIAPGILLDYALTFLVGEVLFISSFGIWIYGLAVALVILNELRGAEGLLLATTTTLKERTQELEFSHAELELVHGELTQKEQLAAVGELAQAIAHEVRNPLAVIINAASGLRRQVGEKDKQTLLSIIDEESARLNELVGELLRFARPMKPAAAVVHVEEICADLASGLAPYQLVFRGDGQDKPELHVDAGLLRLALGYLTQNAAQAMATPGEIFVVLRRGHLNDGSPAVVVEVQDSGVGMSVEILEKAKKPFFTTRPRGTGLGLSIVDRIAEAHGGELEFRSTPGKGTTVLLRFPVLESGDGARSAPPSKRRKLRQRFADRLSEPGEASPSSSESASVPGGSTAGPTRE